ncbi:MarR family transcriptional regulator [Paenalkalicoccus suaedae]|uniref:MarR family transcriptional regulator n=1 Tax=Paenalkalicoccus suaedae TaxID=2592382 RepID=A0A859FFD3_9BACI|nr:MarR family transcriptional regulator [Paenalkalicoccus suaedae]QKS71817.1 MarR family transcriptional regulator [Paenalkalicoccus suaedae]
MKKEDQLEQIQQQIIDISLTLTHRFGHQPENNLSPNQQLLLYLLHAKDLKHVKELAHYMNLSASAVSQMAAKLEQQGLLKREVDPQNRRNTILTLDEEGVSTISRMLERRQTIFSDYFAKLPNQDITSICEALEKLRTIILNHQEEGDRHESN